MKFIAPDLIRAACATALFFAFACAVPDQTLCGQYENVTDASNIYTSSTNVWGQDQSGSSCVKVADNATTLSTTWSWSANETLVHAYPNINYNPIQRDPIQISSLSSIDVKVSWSMKRTASTSASAFDTSGLAAVNAKTNVAFDVFFDTKPENAVNTTAPRYEVMVWIGKFGSILPIGAADAGLAVTYPVYNIGKEKFTLYQGFNDNRQYVFSWIANSNRTVFEGDISPLIHYLWRHGLILSTNYIGVIQFGTEQKHATSNVTFSVDNYSVGATRGAPKAAAGTYIRVPRSEIAYALIATILLGSVEWLN